MYANVPPRQCFASGIIDFQTNPIDLGMQSWEMLRPHELLEKAKPLWPGLAGSHQFSHEANMAVDLSPLVKAAAGLEEGLARYRRDTSDTQIRDGLIQRFEFTYDLSHKMLRRVLEHSAANQEEIDRMSFPTLICTAHEKGLIAGDWPLWRTFREMRNMTSHTYDEAKALAVAAAIPGFLAEAQDLLERLGRQSAV